MDRINLMGDDCMMIKPSTSLRNEYNDEETLELREKLLAAETARLQGAKTYSREEAMAKLEALLHN